MEIGKRINKEQSEQVNGEGTLLELENVERKVFF